MSSLPPITLIAGPTASGKSRLALETAARTGAVIINADSQQLYADLRILSARPTAADEQLVPHALYGVADAAEAWSVGRWTRTVTPLLDQLRADGRAALIVGGTGLYFTALTRGLAEIPDVPIEARDAAMALYDLEGEASFRRQLIERDPVAAASIEVGDRQRLTRAWAVAESTGRSLSEWQATTTPVLAPGTYERLLVEPDRTALYENCDQRVRVMIESGALDEVSALVARQLDPALPAMKAVGVRELSACLRGESSLETASAATQQTTRNYAKRQLTWFRNQTADWPRVLG
ncbi:tRNA (adenosine(37)-N6)-dimethylallyltransferase MiaA [Brevundimonas variabilis]|uniref:tRNA dimethylallyltransferase n=1 Tax=Brevundimonas variabilis TaxID=74312 RepID=A0A7W9CHK2_9CAUL|nr:tRNA (adenosine(37)-N6)-dimethylallyltransferase MiaA [Brevundimonas variabilis]MBB5745779.1 tRNA dimethylallyltransferase [Brevundimonas variabilis]